MFDSIVESVLNEISAEDAYNKFYNFIDRNEFNQIVTANKGKFDKLVRFIMDSIKANEIDSFIEKAKKIKNNDLFIIYQPFIKEFYPMYLEWQKNGVHGITAAERRKEFKLFENLKHKGIPYSQWPDYWKNLFFEF